MSDADYPERDYTRYRSLGLIANPFIFNQRASESPGMSAEIMAASNLLLNAIARAASTEKPGPIRIDKTTEFESYYSSRAVSETEYSLVHDEELDVLNAYIPLFALRKGRVRMTLNIVGERLAFRSFDKTLALYAEHVFENPDQTLASYPGDDAVKRYRSELREDAPAAIERWFGELEVERRPELAEITDTRLMDLPIDNDATDESGEYDPSMGDAPASVNLIALPEEDEDLEPESQVADEIVDYLIEHTSVHLSPVIARALRVYRQRGLAAMTFEFGITKAPRKTLAALVKFARFRYRKVVIMYDGFENWYAIDPEIKTKLISTFSEIRWMLDGDAFLVFMLETGVAPELREQFASAEVLNWDFSGLIPLSERTVEALPRLADRWFGAAALPNSTPITSGDPVISALIETAAGDVDAFVGMARAAVESAATRSVDRLDEAAREAGLTHMQVQE